VALPIFAGAVVVGIVHVIWRPSLHTGAFFVLSVAAAITLFKARTYALKVQDRVIRLEERLRLSILLPEPLRSRIPELTEGQLVALRFASDAEVARLAERALTKSFLRRISRRPSRTGGRLLARVGAAIGFPRLRGGF